MRYPTLVEATALRREKRFLCHVRLNDGTETIAHCANPGRMTSSFAPGALVRLSHHDNPRRKLKWTVEQILTGDTWVMVNTQHPNRAVVEALRADRIPELSGYPELLTEQRYGERSRVDVLLRDGERRAWVEVKSVTLRVGDAGLFPDAVTARGTRHLRELASMAERGDRAVLLFVVSRGDVDRVGPAYDVDPVYGETLRNVVEAGVEVLAWRAEVTESTYRLEEAVPFTLDP